jgi:hypothetical protein
MARTCLQQPYLCRCANGRFPYVWLELSTWAALSKGFPVHKFVSYRLQITPREGPLERLDDHCLGLLLCRDCAHAPEDIHICF